MIIVLTGILEVDSVQNDTILNTVPLFQMYDLKGLLLSVNLILKFNRKQI